MKVVTEKNQGNPEMRCRKGWQPLTVIVKIRYRWQVFEDLLDFSIRSNVCNRKPRVMKVKFMLNNW